MTDQIPSAPGGGSRPAARPALGGAVAELRRMLLLTWGVLAVAATAATAVTPARPWAATATAVAAAGLLAAGTWWTTSHAVAGGEGMTGWVAGGYLLKAAIVAGALIAARTAQIGHRWVGLWMIAAVVACAGSEVVALTRRRAPAVDAGAEEHPAG
ncbi:hypothetical protein ACFQWG_03285 [Schaalia naturae]|uniref:Uncharacterized protein n=1 Tax=Schaalia naturae TaxID=635203 RepID=A0ABW2SJE2_9ACTO